MGNQVIGAGLGCSGPDRQAIREVRDSPRAGQPMPMS